jgi:hypothetical protein
MADEPERGSHEGPPTPRRHPGGAIPVVRARAHALPGTIDALSFPTGATGRREGDRLPGSCSAALGGEGMKKREVVVEIELAMGDGRLGVLELAEKLATLADAVLQVDDVREFKMDGVELSLVSRPSEIMPNPGPCAFQFIAMSKEEAEVELDKLTAQILKRAKKKH